MCLKWEQYQRILDTAYKFGALQCENTIRNVFVLLLVNLAASSRPSWLSGVLDTFLKLLVIFCSCLKFKDLANHQICINGKCSINYICIYELFCIHRHLIKHFTQFGCCSLTYGSYQRRYVVPNVRLLAKSLLLVESTFVSIFFLC